ECRIAAMNPVEETGAGGHDGTGEERGEPVCASLGRQSDSPCGPADLSDAAPNRARQYLIKQAARASENGQRQDQETEADQATCPGLWRQLGLIHEREHDSPA